MERKLGIWETGTLLVSQVETLLYSKSIESKWFPRKDMKEMIHLKKKCIKSLEEDRFFTYKHI